MNYKKKKINLLNGEITELDKDSIALSARRAIHRNIVKVPEYCFSGQTKNKNISELIRGDWQLGILDNYGEVINKNLKKGITLRYTREKGVEILKDKNNREIDNEPCD